MYCNRDDSKTQLEKIMCADLREMGRFSEETDALVKGRSKEFSLSNATIFNGSDEKENDFAIYRDVNSKTVDFI